MRVVTMRHRAHLWYWLSWGQHRLEVTTSRTEWWVGARFFRGQTQAGNAVIVTVQPLPCIQIVYTRSLGWDDEDLAWLDADQEEDNAHEAV